MFELCSCCCDADGCLGGTSSESALDVQGVLVARGAQGVLVARGAHGVLVARGAHGVLVARGIPSETSSQTSSLALDVQSVLEARGGAHGVLAAGGSVSAARRFFCASSGTSSQTFDFDGCVGCVVVGESSL